MRTYMHILLYMYMFDVHSLVKGQIQVESPVYAYIHAD
jgi:hypothetical protein